MDFFRVLAAARLKHPIMNEERKFFKDSYPSTSREKKNENAEKPITIIEYQKKALLEQFAKSDNLEETEEDLKTEKLKHNEGLFLSF